MAKKTDAMCDSNGEEGGREIKRLTAFALKRNEEGVDIKIIGCFGIKSAPSQPFYSKGVIVVGGRSFSVFDLQSLAGLSPKTLTEESCIVLLDFDHEHNHFSRAIVVDDVTEMLSIADQNMSGPKVENLFGCQLDRGAKAASPIFPGIEPERGECVAKPEQENKDRYSKLV